MPGYVIHLAIANEYCKKHSITGASRDELLKGSIEPDLKGNKKVTHYGYDSAHPNLKRYLESNSINTPFLKGYFLHLLSDFIFYNYYYKEALERNFIFHDDFDTINFSLMKRYNVVLPKFLDDIVKFSSNSPEVINWDTIIEFIDNVSSMDLESAIKQIKNLNTINYDGKQVSCIVPEKDPNFIDEREM